jgi:methylmalonyl-CoA/ethylmalonyl-CoA epimerase
MPLAREVDHIGVLTDDLEGVRRLAELLGVAAGPAELVPALGVEILWLTLGATRLEVLRPTDPAGRAAQALAATGPGVHHVAFRVDDVDSALDVLRAAGVALRDEVPRVGAHATRIAFVEPGGAGGLLVELVEHPA